VEMSVVIPAIALAIAMGAVSPGPSFLVVARTALAISRQDALAVALGMGFGAIGFAVLALFGLLLVFAAVPLLYLLMKAAGGAYLCHMGYRIWRDAPKPLVIDAADGQGAPRTRWRSFSIGFATQISNPKTAVVYTTVFASLLPPGAPWQSVAPVPVLVFFIEAGWYCVVAVALSAAAPRARYLASKVWLDRAAGAVMTALGLKLLLDLVLP
jgi:threonine/homoserine/homoserine lactone efflux protein